MRTGLEGSAPQEVVAGRGAALRALPAPADLPSLPLAAGGPPRQLAASVACGGQLLLWGVGLTRAAAQQLVERSSLAHSVRGAGQHLPY
jgi:hypothetical protein